MRRPILALLAASLLCPPVQADEGMWLPDQIHQLEPLLKPLGLEMNPSTLSDLEGGPAAAVVSFDFGTGSFVSPDGLIITNHHVAYDAIQANSDASHDYLQDGFLARHRADELPAPGYHATLIREMADVTARVLAAIPEGADDLARQKSIEATSKALVSECEKVPDQRCLVVPMYGGLKYYLQVGLELRDVRLVYAPSVRIGDYGGEIDNFRWPRHSGDFSFMRAYVGPDGRPADPSKENVPFKPKVHLKLASTPLRDGDLVMTWGFPGYTSRYRTAAHIDFFTEKALPADIAFMKRRLKLIDDLSAQSRARAIRLASERANVENYLTNAEGKLIALRRTDLFTKRRAEEQKLQAWIDADPARKKSWGDVLSRLEALNAEEAEGYARQAILRRVSRSVTLMGLAIDLVRGAEERANPDLERDPRFMDRALPEMRDWFDHAQTNLDPELDRTLLEYIFLDALDLPAGQKIDAVEKLAPGKTKAAREKALKAELARRFQATKLTSREARLKLFDGPAAVGSSRDPLIELARALYPDMKAANEQLKARQGALSRLEPRLLEARQAFSPRPLYPDANSTLRFSYGTIQGYAPADAVLYQSFTTIGGQVAKHRGKAPFDLPQPLIDAAKGAESHPLDFLSTNDTTGGNSGSPVLNGRGELAGLLFDGNYESTGDDYVFWTEMQRSICLDLRYILWVMEKVDRAAPLLTELGR